MRDITMDNIPEPPMYFDMEGKPITLRQWADGQMPTPEGKNPKVVKQEHVGDYFISTVLLGLDHSFGSGPPLIFETMIFNQSDDAKELGNDWLDTYCERYSTKEQALEGHQVAVEYAKNLV